jgi:protoheme IX farnesyltransferase
MSARASLLPQSAAYPAAGPCLRLLKPRIAALATLSAAAGFALAGPDAGRPVVLPLAGLFVLACGCGALNQYQERELDALMPRTRRRPLPAGEIRPRAALKAAVCLLTAGVLLLQRGGGGAAALLGVLAVLWYNGIYTGLKRRTALALLPGAAVGALPPAIGWVCAGGAIADPRLGALCALLFLWQVPHFGLLLLTHGDEYARAGLPVASDLLPRRQFARLVLFCLLGTAAGGLLLPLPEAAAGLRALRAAAALALAGCCRGVLVGGPPGARRAFHAVNAYLLLVLVLAVAAAQ